MDYVPVETDIIMKPEISVIIPAFKAENTICQTLESITDQFGDNFIEIIVSINSNFDNTYNKVKNFAKSLTGSSKATIKIIESYEVANANYARNKAVSIATAPFLLFCDADDVVGKYWINNSLKALQVSSVFSGIAINIDDSLFPNSVNKTREIFDKKFDGIDLLEQSGNYQVLMGGNFGIHKELFYQLGGFDTMAPSQVDDDEFALRITTAGYNIVLNRTSLIGYRIRDDWESKLERSKQGAYAKSWLYAVYNLDRQSHFDSPFLGIIKTHFLLPLYNSFRKNIDPRAIKMRKIIARSFALGYLNFSVLKNYQRGIGKGLF